jgi:hypothetical protein
VGHCSALVDFTQTHVLGRGQRGTDDGMQTFDSAFFVDAIASREARGSNEVGVFDSGDEARWLVRLN